MRPESGAVVQAPLSHSLSAERPAVVARLRAAGCVFAEEEARLLLEAARTPVHLSALVNRRAAGAPIEHVIGWAEFCGLRVAVDMGVFVPRRRSELLARRATPLARRAARASGTAGSGAGPWVVDLCCGSGAVGLAVATRVPAIALHAVDVDPVAVGCARRNLAAVGGRVHQGDLFAPLPPALRGRIDVLIANAPYVPSHAIGLLPAEARLHEPRVALDGGPDGLDVQRRVIAAAPLWLAPGGHLLLEAAERQAPLTARAATGRGLTVRVARSRRLDATVVIATKPRR